MRNCAASFPAPRVTLEGLDHFKEPAHAILILRAKGEPPLSPLHDALVNALTAKELPCTREPFEPHVTLAHKADARALPFISQETEPFAFQAERICLFLSARDEQNVLRYTPLAFEPFFG